MVRINRVTTKTGDTGTTALGDGSRLSKDDDRIEALGAVDEANACIGVLRLHTRHDNEADATLARIQNDLFDVGADLCMPKGKARLRVTDAAIARLEHEVASMNAELPPLTSFVLPGGGAAGAYAHLARTVVRKAERAVVKADGAGSAVQRYLNRLSDHLFVLARRLNADGDEVLWVPGAHQGS
ncbi:MAG TPA: cob(I)yrinic acid a,c-diamide adenosyltransferase [Rhodopila sp.]|uniref:cob(I)yrinic acid a,c-diamide adenosyltransferase n=1 Tax=Rhodopila sp. TaxID=2480087 RepID=UPI002CCE77EC|nr:cob(I)yrinic acid a,c-diamide adenosyltransferase [Rhodopila sp.]HVY18184.1 cob(I)yrinic acid a,c-diamide adenosyltransferase [Rhodopila sp.]